MAHRLMIKKPLKISTYLSPKYWGTWLLFLIMRLIALLPLSVIEKIGAGFGLLIYRLIPSRRRVARINIKLAYPEYSEQQIKTLMRQSFISLGISVFETGLAWWANRDYLRERCSTEGLEHLEDALAKGNGVILLTGHFTTLEIGGILMALYTPLNAIYKKAHNKMFNDFMVYYRELHLKHVIDNKDVRAFIKGLKNGDATWYAPDQSSGGKNTVFTPFLGGIASTLTSASRITDITHAAIVPFYPVRLGNGKGYKLVIRKALENLPSGNVTKDAENINLAIDKMVRQLPEQYAWIHKRFKHRPEGASSIY